MTDYILEKLDKKTIFFLMIFFAIIFFSIFMDSIPILNKDEVVTNETVMEYFSKIDDNYTIDVNVTKDDKLEHYMYYTDSKIELYEDNDGNGYIKYNDSFYSVNSSSYEVTKIKDKSINIYDKYSNIKLIKNVIPLCEYKYINKANIECNLKIDDYINEYNKLYDTEIPSIEGTMLIHINHLEKYLNYLEIDYSNIYKLIDSKDNKLKYKIGFVDIGTNDFSKLIEKYKDELK